jgi:spoIIIJ-associated protein
MYKSIEAVGKTEEEAIASALTQIGKERDEVSVEIIERSRSGFLGIGSSPAKVRISYEYVESVVEQTQRFLTGFWKKWDRMRFRKSR